MEIKPLSDMEKGMECSVCGFVNPQSEYAEKLIKMGFVEGTLIQRSSANINDPLIFSVRHSRVALRKKEAEQILVREIYL